VRDDEQSETNSGRLFHARGPATAKARCYKLSIGLSYFDDTHNIHTFIEYAKHAAIKKYSIKILYVQLGLRG